MACVLVLGILLAGFGADQITTLAEDKFYQDRIIFTTARPTSASWSPGQGYGTGCFLNGNLQFSESDEYRYHEPWCTRHGRTGARGWRCWAAATAWRCARSLKYPRSNPVTLVELDQP